MAFALRCIGIALLFYKLSKLKKTIIWVLLKKMHSLELNSFFENFRISLLKNGIDFISRLKSAALCSPRRSVGTETTRLRVYDTANQIDSQIWLHEYNISKGISVS